MPKNKVTLPVIANFFGIRDGFYISEARSFGDFDAGNIFFGDVNFNGF